MRKFITCSLATAVRLLSSLDGTFAADDWQYWNEIKLKHGVTESLDVHLKIEQRFVDDFDDFALHNYSPGMVYRVTKHIYLELDYKYEREKDGE